MGQALPSRMYISFVFSLFVRRVLAYFFSPFFLSGGSGEKEPWDTLL